ncbi:MAG: GTP 3',8-cyclase MoaA [Candidatus Limivivens sp.]|nr:GTP 3',8-cyclase MoaA [Candidatus Limivivens sp.]
MEKQGIWKRKGIMTDQYGRNIDYMRLSITDRCNLRCCYCMPEETGMTAPDRILTEDEILRICECAVALGIRRFKITGGEPLVRKDALELIRRLKTLPGVEKVTLTTNGVLLREVLPELKQMGIDGINVSFDTLSEERYLRIAGRPGLSEAVRALREGISLGIPMKVNCVILKGINDDEITDLAGLAREMPVDVRFIEMMPMGWGKAFEGMPAGEVRQVLRSRYPELEPTEEIRGNGPAVYGRIPGFQGYVGFIDAIHGKFCSRCNRVRLTSEGFLKLCLYYRSGVDLRGPLRAGARKEELIRLMAEAISQKPREHQFNHQQPEGAAEEKGMSQIGG